MKGRIGRRGTHGRDKGRGDWLPHVERVLQHRKMGRRRAARKNGVEESVVGREKGDPVRGAKTHIPQGCGIRSIWLRVARVAMAVIATHAVAEVVVSVHRAYGPRDGSEGREGGVDGTRGGGDDRVGRGKGGGIPALQEFERPGRHQTILRLWKGGEEGLRETRKRGTRPQVAKHRWPKIPRISSQAR